MFRAMIWKSRGARLPARRMRKVQTSVATNSNSKSHGEIQPVER